MDDPNASGAPRFPLRWDGVVTAGNVLTAVAFLSTLIVWSLRLENRVDMAVKDVDGLQKRLEQTDARRDRSDNEIKTSLQRLDDKLTRYFLDAARPGNRQSP